MPFNDLESGITYPRDREVNARNYTRYKRGANYSDIKRFKDYDKMGYDTFQIAHFTKIVENCVVAHLKPPRQKPGPKPRDPA